jgi:hypothetical protein
MGMAAFILPLVIFTSSKPAEKGHCQCLDLVETLEKETDAAPLLATIVTDSTRLDNEPMKAVSYFRMKDGKKVGKGGVHYSDGFFLSGEYGEEGLREGVWFLFDCRRSLKTMEQFHYNNGHLSGVVTKRKIKRKRLDHIPLIY